MSQANEALHHDWLLHVMADHRSMTRELRQRQQLHQLCPGNRTALYVIEQRDLIDDVADLLLMSVPTSHCEMVYALCQANTSTF